MSKGRLVVRLIGDDRDLRGALRSSKAAVHGWAGGMAGISGRVAGLFAGISLAQFTSSSVAAFHESEEASVALENTLRNNKQLAGETAASFQRLASALQAKTRADDESITKGVAVLGNFRLTGDQIRDTLPLVVDYARKTGRDVPTAAGLIGKALLGNTRALKELGITGFKPTGDAAKDFAALTDLLRAKVGGFAEQEAKTSAGRLDIMKNKFNDLQEVIGQKVIGALDFVVSNLNILGPIVAGITTGLIAWKLASAATAVATTILGQAATATWMATLGPIALVVGAIVGIGLAVYAFRDKVSVALHVVANFFEDLGGDIKRILVGAFQFVLDKFLAIGEWLVRGAAAAFGWIPGIGPQLKEAARQFEKFRDDVNASFDAIKGTKTIEIQVVGPDFIGPLAPWQQRAAGPQRRARGGSVQAGVPYIVGEEGPELRVFSKSGAIVPNNKLRGAGNYFDFRGAQFTGPEDLKRQVLAALDAAVRARMAV